MPPVEGTLERWFGDPPPAHLAAVAADVRRALLQVQPLFWLMLVLILFLTGGDLGKALQFFLQNNVAVQQGPQGQQCHRPQWPGAAACRVVLVCGGACSDLCAVLVHRGCSGGEGVTAHVLRAWSGVGVARPEVMTDTLAGLTVAAAAP